MIKQVSGPKEVTEKGSPLPSYFTHSDALLDAGGARIVAEDVAKSCSGVAGGVTAMEMVVDGLVDHSGSHWVNLGEAVEDILNGAGDVEVVGNGGVVDLNGPIHVDDLVGLVGRVQNLGEAIGSSLDNILAEY